MPVPAQSPLQPENPAPLAVSVTLLPLSNGCAQKLLLLQVIPAGVDVTVPPTPVTVTEKTGRSKVAVTVEVPINVNVQGFVVPLQILPPPVALLQLTKFDDPLGVAVSVIVVPTG